MAYLGSVPAPIPTNFQQVNAQSFNGNGSTVAFTLSRPVQYTKDIEVLVNNVQQNPYSGSYSVSGTTLTFTEAPSSGSSNIYVIYRDHPLTSISPADASVTTIKIADGAVTPEKIAEGAALPSQTGQSGKYLTTDGTNATWETIVTAPTPANVSDQENTSTGFFDLPAGTTAQRPVSPTTGMTRFNTSTNRAEVYDGNIWAEFGTPPPSINTVTPTTYNGEQGTSFTINGANFTSDATVYFIDNVGTEYLAATVSYLSASQLTATTPRDFTVAEEPLDVKVIQSSGVITKLDVIDCGGLPAWTTASGLLATFEENDPVETTVEATDPDSGATIAYSVASGSLPMGLTIDNETGVIAGNTPYVDSLTTYNFGLRATDNAGNTADRNFSLAVNPQDQYAKSTVLLLNGDGTNGAQNNTFLDSSTNNFTITRNGNTTQGTFSPFSVADGEWSNYFAGSQRISAPANSAFQYGLGDFTIEAWVYLNGITGDQVVVDGRASNGNFTDCFSFTISNGALTAYTNAVTNLGGSVSANQWVHVALTRQSGTLKGWVNGTQTGTTANWSAVNINNAGCQATMGAVTGGTVATLVGYVSNVRCVKGRAVYTSNFTPSTSPLGVTSGGQNPPQGTETSLLTCQSNRFVDNSSNAFTITVAGTPSVQPFSPFAPSAAYDASVNGGSGYFDGNGDYLTLATNAALDMGTGDFTVEMWVYSTDASLDTQYRRFFASDVNGTSSIQIGHIVSTNGVAEYCDNGSSGVLISGTTNILNQWAHIAAVRSSGTVTLYVNGVSEGTPASDTGNKGSADFTIGKYPSASGHLKGWLASLRVVKGTAVYTTTFTPPTAPLTAIANTSLLCNLTNAGIYDSTGKNNLETVGNAQIDTTVKKYGTGSMEFDGTGDSLFIRNSPEFSFGTGDFTIEAWVYRTANGGYPLIVKSSVSNTWADGWSISFGLSTDADKLQFWINANLIISSTNDVSLNAWNHIAVSRSGTSLRLFVNGIQEASITNSTSINTTSPLSIGSDVNKTDYPYTGYIDDLRITKGVARYTSNFTPPTRGLRIK